MKPGNIIHVKLSCPLVDLGKWTSGGFEVVEVQADQIVVKRPGEGRPGRWAVRRDELTIGKGHGTSAESRRRARRRSEMSR